MENDKFWVIVILTVLSPIVVGAVITASDSNWQCTESRIIDGEAQCVTKKLVSPSGEYSG
jgi:hypothetical protein